MCDSLKKIHEALTRQNVNPSEPSLWIRYLLNLTPGKWNNYWTIDVWTYLTTICGCECLFFWHISMCRLCVIEKCHVCPNMTRSLRPERVRLGQLCWSSAHKWSVWCRLNCVGFLHFDIDFVNKTISDCPCWNFHRLSSWSLGTPRLDLYQNTMYHF